MPCVAVQHHHAHIASCLAEHGRTDRVIGVAFDGTGCGPQGDVWGGEFLLADRAEFGATWTSASHRDGRRGSRDPGAMAARRRRARRCRSLARRVLARRQDASRGGFEQMLERGVSVLPATGAGRWFDAVASILGVRDVISYEGQAAIELEALAGGDGECPAHTRSRSMPAPRPHSSSTSVRRSAPWRTIRFAARRTGARVGAVPRHARRHRARGLPPRTSAAWNARCRAFRRLLPEPAPHRERSPAAPRGRVRGAPAPPRSTQRRRRVAGSSSGRRATDCRRRDACASAFPVK